MSDEAEHVVLGTVYVLAGLVGSALLGVVGAIAYLTGSWVLYFLRGWLPH